jgi:hypothetical protein
VTDIPFADRVQGRDGAILQDAWAGSPRAYLGTSIPGFPNFFMLLGPNTGLGHSSMVYMIESQVAHVLGALTGMAAAGANRIEVRHDAYERFNRQLDGRMQGTVWDTGGCTSFYVDRTGRNATIWPDFTWRFRHRTRQSPLEAYTMSAAQLELVAA